MFADIPWDDVVKWLGIVAAGALALIAFIKDHLQHSSNAKRIDALEKK